MPSLRFELGTPARSQEIDALGLDCSAIAPLLQKNKHNKNIHLTNKNLLQLLTVYFYNDNDHLSIDVCPCEFAKMFDAGKSQR